MLPTIIELGPIPIHSFGLMLVLSFFASWRCLTLTMLRAGDDPNDAEPIVFWAALGGILGGRLLYLLSFPAELMHDPMGTIFGGAGFVFYGGLLGGMLAVIVVLRRQGKRIATYADLVTAPIAIGYAVGRIGCHLAGDGDYGSVTDLPWGFRYSMGVVPSLPGVFHHPAPLYETLGALLIAAILLRLLARQPGGYGGRLFGFYLMLSASARFLVEFIRLEPRFSFGLSQAQYISVLLFAVGALLTVLCRRSIVGRSTEGKSV